MLVAIHKKSAQRVKAIEYDTAHALRSKFPPGELVCPFCDEMVFSRERKGFVLHFVHRHPCTSNIARHPESPEHEQGKYELAKFLRQQLKDDPSQCARVEVEYRLRALVNWGGSQRWHALYELCLLVNAKPNIFQIALRRCASHVAKPVVTKPSPAQPMQPQPPQPDYIQTELFKWDCFEDNDF